MRVSYEVTNRGYVVIHDGAVVVSQDFDPRVEGIYPVPEEDREPMAIAAMRDYISMNSTRPIPTLDVHATAFGPDADLAQIDGGDMRVLFRRGKDGRCENGISARVEARLYGRLLDGTGGLPCMDDTFSMPFQPVDALGNPSGPAIMALVQFRAGAATVMFAPQEPVAYVVTSESINRKLPPSKRLFLSETIQVQGVNA